MSIRKWTKSGLTARFLVAALIALAMVAVSLVAVACDEDTEDTTATTADAGGDGDAVTADKGEIEIGWVAWDECIANTYLWKTILEEQGYTVTLTQLDVAPVYTGLANGDIDFFVDAWLPNTQAGYWEEFGDQIELLGVINENATLSLTVPAYVEGIDSLEDLKGNADLFDGVITGIEPGAGMMGLLADEVMPGYGLDDEYELLESSTPAMIVALQNAIAEEEPIVVTLWRPHWVYGAMDLKDLEDPQGLWGEADQIQVLGRSGFAEDFPEVAEWLGNFMFTDEALAGISAIVIDEYGTGEEEAAIEAWLSDADNQALVDSWLGM